MLSILRLRFHLSSQETEPFKNQPLSSRFTEAVFERSCLNKRFQEYYCGCSWAKLRRKKTDVSSIENALVWMGPWTKDSRCNCSTNSKTRAIGHSTSHECNRFASLISLFWYNRPNLTEWSSILKFTIRISRETGTPWMFKEDFRIRVDRSIFM